MENDFFLDVDAFRIIMNYDNSEKYRWLTSCNIILKGSTQVARHLFISNF